MSSALHVSETGRQVEIPSDERFALLMSIQPRFAEAILAGTKTVELRRKPPRDVPDVVIIYGSGAAKAVLGAARLKAVHTSTPDDIWERFGRTAGVTRKEFDDYFAASETASALVMTAPRRSAQEISLSRLREIGLEPPQSWRYVERRIATVLLDGLGFHGVERRIRRRDSLPRWLTRRVALANLGLVETTSRLNWPMMHLVDSVRCIGLAGVLGREAIFIRGSRSSTPRADLD